MQNLEGKLQNLEGKLQKQHEEQKDCLQSLTFHGLRFQGYGREAGKAGRNFWNVRGFLGFRG